MEEEEKKKELNELFNNTFKGQNKKNEFDGGAEREVVFTNKLNTVDNDIRDKIKNDIQNKQVIVDVDSSNKTILKDKDKNVSFQKNTIKQQLLSSINQKDYSKTVVLDKNDNVNNRRDLNQFILKLFLKSRANQKNILKFQNFIGDNDKLIEKQRNKFEGKNPILDRVLLLARQLYLSQGDMIVLKSLEKDESRLIYKEIELKEKLVERTNLIEDINNLARQLGLSLSIFLTMTIEELKKIKEALKLELKKKKEREQQSNETPKIVMGKVIGEKKQQNIIDNGRVDVKQQNSNDRVKDNSFVNTTIDVMDVERLKKNQKVANSIDIINSKPVVVSNTVATKIGAVKSNVDLDANVAINVNVSNDNFVVDTIKNSIQTKDINLVSTLPNIANNSKINFDGFMVESDTSRTRKDFKKIGTSNFSVGVGKIEELMQSPKIVKSTVIVLLHDRTKESWTRGYRKAKDILSVEKEFDKRVEKNRIEEDMADLNFWPKEIIDHKHSSEGQVTKYERIEELANGEKVLVKKKIIMLHDINEQDLQRLNSDNSVAVINNLNTEKINKNTFKVFSLNSDNIKVDSVKDIEILKKQLNQQGNNVAIKNNNASVDSSINSYMNVKEVEKQQKTNVTKDLSNVVKSEPIVALDEILKKQDTKKSDINVENVNSTNVPNIDFSILNGGEPELQVHTVLLCDRTQKTWTNAYDYMKYKLSIKDIRHNKKKQFWKVKSKIDVDEDTADLKFWPKKMISDKHGKKGQLTIYNLIDEQGKVLAKEGILMLHDIDLNRLKNQDLTKIVGVKGNKEINKDDNFRVFSSKYNDIKIDSVENVELLKEALKRQSKELIKNEGRGITDDKKPLVNGGKKNPIKDVFGRCGELVVLLKDKSRETWNKMYNKAKEILKINEITDKSKLIEKKEHIYIDSKDLHNKSGKGSKIIPMDKIRLNDAGNIKVKSTLAMITKNNSVKQNVVELKQKQQSKGGYSISFKAMARDANLLDKNSRILDKVKTIRKGYSTFLTGNKIIKDIGNSIKTRAKTFSNGKKIKSPYVGLDSKNGKGSSGPTRGIN